MQILHGLRKWKLLLLAISLFLALLFVHRVWQAKKSWDKLWSDANRLHIFTECDPNDLLPALEQAFMIKFPERASGVSTARTRGSWDSTNSDFIVRFHADPNIVAAFIQSFPDKIHFSPYDKAKDTRYSHSKYPRPEWFTEPIREGQIGDVEGYGDRGIIIDTNSEQRNIVYFYGYYERTPDDINREEANSVSTIHSERKQ
jgi:hypothetical protein